MADLSKFLEKRFSAKSMAGQDPIILTIKDAKVEEVGQTREPKPVVSFLEDPRSLVLNTTKYNDLAAANKSRDVSKWTGTRVQLSHDPSVRFGGKEIGGIVLKVVQPAVTE